MEEDKTIFSYGCYDHDYPNFNEDIEEEFEWER